MLKIELSNYKDWTDESTWTRLEADELFEEVAEGALPRSVQRQQAIPHVDHREPLAFRALVFPLQRHLEESFDFRGVQSQVVVRPTVSDSV